MSVWDFAHSKTVSEVQASGAGGDTTALITVPNGEVWEVSAGMGWHGDPAARDCQWRIQDAITMSPRNLASSVPAYLCSGYDGANFIANVFAAPIRLYAGDTVRFTVTAAAAAINVTAQLWVRYLRGIEQPA